MENYDPATWGALVTAALIGIAAIVGAFARPLFASIFHGKPRGCPMTEHAIAQLDQLHDWHGPDDRGEQGWRGHGIERQLSVLEQRAAESFKQMREGQKETSGLLRELVKVVREK